MNDTDQNLEAVIARAVEQGVARALAEIGLENGKAREDIRDLRALLHALRLAQRTAWQTMVRLVTTAVFALLLAGLAWKLHLFNGGN